MKGILSCQRVETLSSAEVIKQNKTEQMIDIHASNNVMLLIQSCTIKGIIHKMNGILQTVKLKLKL